MDSVSLNTFHRADLMKSGIDDKVAQLHGMKSLSDPDEIGLRLRWNHRSKIHQLGSCLFLPYYDHAGARIDYCRVKPTNPPTFLSGKPSKYLGPKGVPVRVYFPKINTSSYQSLSIPLFVTEGEKKAICASIHGFLCIGLGGVACWSKKRQKDKNGIKIGERELHDDLASLPWQGREVYIAFDSDRSTKREVQREENALAMALKAQGARVKVIQLPSTTSGNKQGIDDFLCTFGAEAFARLITEAIEPQSLEKDSAAQDAVDNPHRLAQSFLAKGAGDKIGVIRYWNNDFIRYEAGAYRLHPQGDMKPCVTEHVRQEYINYSKRLSCNSSQKFTKPVKVRQINDVMNALQSITYLSSSHLPPSWIGSSSTADRPDPYTLLPMKNGILQLDSENLASGTALLPLDPNLFTMNAVPFDYDAGATKPERWMEFLHQLWPLDIQAVSCLQEWFGYLLTSDTRLQKMLMLIGPKRSGKGTILRILAKVLGKGNVVSPTLSSLGTQFGLAPLLGKSVAIISDARLSNRNDQAVITERILSITGEDTQTIDRKYRDPISAKLLTRFVIASNELPRLTDTSGALSGRMILLKLSNSFFGKEDIHLDDKLSTELPGILLWAIEGLLRLRQRGRFLQPDSSNSIAQELEDLVSPIGAFIREECIVESTASVEIAEMYRRWKEWCEEQGRQHPGSLQTFGRDLHAACSGLSVARPSQGGRRVRVYLGIRLRRIGDPEIEVASATSAMSADFPFVTNQEHPNIKEDRGREVTIGKTTDIADTADSTPMEEGVFEL